MKGLFIKDLYTLTKQLKLFLVLILVFALWPDGGMVSFAVVYAGLLPITAMAYDEQSKWNQLAAMMPYTTFQLVFSKYLLGYFLLLGTCLISMVSQGLAALFTGGSVAFDAYGGILLVALILVAASLPLLFRFSVEKGRLVFLVLTAAVAAGAYIAADRAAWILERVGFYGALVVLAVLLNVGSVLLSRRFYRRRVW